MQLFNRRKLCIASVFVGLTLSVPATARSFFSQIEDLPLAPGMEEVGPASLFFQSASGRIVVAVARGEEKIFVLRRFYAKSLPPLGWHFVQTGIYRRNSEMLKIRFQEVSGKVSIYLHIVPIKNR